MKKLFFMAAVAALAFTSCTKEETIGQSATDAIGFGTHISKITRGVPVGGTQFIDGSTIRVWGYYTDATVAGDNLTGATGIVHLNDPAGTDVAKVSGTWKYTPVAYWMTGKYHHFFAISNSSVGTNIDQTGSVTITVADALSDQNDIMVAAAAKNIQTSTEVSFAFQHVLSQIRFSAKLIDAVAEVTDVTIKDVTIKPATGNFMTEATINTFTALTPLAQTPAAGTGSASYTVTPTAPVAIDDSEFTLIYNGDQPTASAIGETPMLIPQTAASGLEITFKVDYKLSSVAATTKDVKFVTTSDLTWEPAKIYTYNVSISALKHILGYSDTAIAFGDPTITDWTTGTATGL